MKTTAFLLLLFIHLVAFTQISSNHTSHSIENFHEFFNRKKNHSVNRVIVNKNIPDLKGPLNPEFKQMKSQTLEKIKQKEKPHNEIFYKLRGSFLSSLNQEFFILDSLHVYSFSSPTDSLLNGKIFLIYNESGNNISFYTSELDTVTNQWQFSYKEDYFPDQMGRDTLQIFYNWNVEMNDWVPESKNEIRFDDFGNIINTAWYIWEYLASKWIGEFKTEYAYDEFGNQSYFAYYTWDIDLSEWIGLLKNESEFDVQGNQIASSDYYWDQNLNIWRGDHKYIIEIQDDENGYYQSFVVYVWDETNSQWIEYSKTEYTLNSMGKIIYEAFYNWDEVSESWKGDNKSEYFYVEGSQDFNRIYYSWSEAINDWIYSEKSEILFNEFGSNLHTRNYVWKESISEWILVSKVDNNFNEINLLEESFESSLKDTAISVQLIKGFDSIDEEILIIIGDNSCEDKSCFTIDDEFTEGTGAVNWSYDILDFEEWGGYSQIQLSNSVNMEGDDGIILFYKNVIPSEARFFLIFMESSGEEWRYEDNFMLSDTAKGWQQFVVPFENFFIPYFRAPVNGIFELDAIESIYIELFVPSGVTAMGSVSMDNFSTFKNEKTEDWIINSTRKLAYDTLGNLVSDSIYNWDNDLKVLAPKYYALKTYDHNNYQTGHESYNWEYNFMGWVGEWKYELTVNEQGYVTSSVLYDWDYGINDWVGSQKNETSYNEQGMETGFASYFWDNNLNIWIGESKEESLYDQFGNRLAEEYSFWNYDDNEWNLSYKIEWNYDGNQELTTEKYYEWDMSAGEWIVADTFLYTQWEEFFNERGNIVMEISKQWDDDLAEWAPVNKYYYFYSEQITDLRIPELEAGQIAEIYPNPASNFVNIRLKSVSRGTASLMDFNGRTIKTELLSGSLNSIPLNDFPAGIYIIQIKTDRNVFSQKLVIQ